MKKPQITKKKQKSSGTNRDSDSRFPSQAYIQFVQATAKTLADPTTRINCDGKTGTVATVVQATR